MTPAGLTLCWSELDAGDAEVARLAGLLDAAECARARRITAPGERRRWTVDRGRRRELLGAWCGIAPESVGYRDGAQGRPRPTTGTPQRAAPDFSAARAGGLALYAVSDTGAVGVDVEPRLQGDLTRLAARMLSPAEQEVLEALAPEDRRPGLTACWARKEAHGKALGTGLVFPLSAHTVWAGDGRPVRCGEVLVRDVELVGCARAAELRAACAELGGGEAGGGAAGRLRAIRFG